MVALRVLYEPRTSISMTDLKAFGLNWFMGARKFPAAPALSFISSSPLFPAPQMVRRWVDLHHIINAA